MANIKHDESVRWSELCEYAIDKTGEANVWHSGRALDVLTIKHYAVIAATTGGVWMIDPSGSNAYPVSDTWPSMEVMSLCRSPLHHEHVFACSGAPLRLYETDLIASKPLLVWKQVPVPTGVETVYCAAASRTTPFRIVIATNAGVFTSPLGAAGGYAWTQAKWTTPANTAMPFTRECSGIAVGQNNVIAAPLDTTDVMFRGAWNTQGQLTLSSVPIPPHNQPNVSKKLNWLTVAACEGAPGNLYVLAFAPDGTMVGVLKSKDDGGNWNWCNFNETSGKSLKDAGGDASAGGRTKHVAVCATDSAKVSIAGIQGFLSTDAGATWRNIKNPHSDLHTIYFDPGDPTGNTLFTASDGGVFTSTNGGTSWRSHLNTKLRTLQCYTPSLVREFWGCLDVFESASTGAVVASGLQDNGNVLLSLNQGQQARWRPFGRGDGGYCGFLPDGSIVYSGVAGEGINAQHASASTRWQGTDIPDANFNMASPRPGIPGPRLYTFNKPWRASWTDSALYGLATSDDERGIVFGLFGKIAGGVEVTHWARLCQLPIDVMQDNDTITAFAEDRNVIYATTAKARFFALSWAAGAYPLEQANRVRNGYIVPTAPTIYEYLFPLGGTSYPLGQRQFPELGYVSMCMQPGGNVWVLAARQKPGADGIYESRIFRTQSIAWQEITLNLADPATSFGPRLQAIYADNRNVYATGDGAVYRLGPNEDEWFNISMGLPKGFLGSDLAKLKAAPGEVLLLSTFNRGVWRMDLP